MGRQGILPWLGPNQRGAQTSHLASLGSRAFVCEMGTKSCFPGWGERAGKAWLRAQPRKGPTEALPPLVSSLGPEGGLGVLSPPHAPTLPREPLCLGPRLSPPRHTRHLCWPLRSHRSGQLVLQVSPSKACAGSLKTPLNAPGEVSPWVREWDWGPLSYPSAHPPPSELDPQAHLPPGPRACLLAVNVTGTMRPVHKHLLCTRLHAGHCRRRGPGNLCRGRRGGFAQTGTNVF